MKPIIVLPTYNERENLRGLVAEIRRQAADLHILIVDDDSPDGTGELADQLRIAYPQEVFVLHREAKDGLGRAYVAGFQYVLERDYDVILQMDADFSHHPGYLPALLRGIEHYDVVLGSRYVHGAKVANWNLRRVVLSKLAGYYCRLITRMPFRDITGGFKCWRRQTLEAIGLDSVRAKGYLFQIETTWRAHRLGARIGRSPSFVMSAGWAVPKSASR